MILKGCTGELRGLVNVVRVSGGCFLSQGLEAVRSVCPVLSTVRTGCRPKDALLFDRATPEGADDGSVSAVRSCLSPGGQMEPGRSQHHTVVLLGVVKLEARLLHKSPLSWGHGSASVGKVEGLGFFGVRPVGLVTGAGPIGTHLRPKAKGINRRQAIVIEWKIILGVRLHSVFVGRPWWRL